MALTLTLAFGAPCPGGNHFTVTATLTPGVSRVFDFTMPDLEAPISGEEQETFARVLIRQYRRQLNGRTRGQQKTAIEAKVLDLGVS